jgi:4-amino-4-deoxy-L-arabinose transferase-like glycosyltransferase
MPEDPRAAMEGTCAPDGSPASVRGAGAVWLTLALLLVAFTGKQMFSVFAFPAFSGHDEVAHMAYLQIVADERRIPVMPDLDEWQRTRIELRNSLSDDEDEALLPGDDIPDAFYSWCRYVLDWYCEPDSPRWGTNPPRVVSVRGEYFPSGWLYTANHPPLYYLLMTPVHLLSKALGLGVVGEHYALRMAAIPFGAATVLFAFLIARAIFPGDRVLQLTTPALVAFQPQIAYESAMVNNDILSIAMFSWLLWLLVTGLRDGFTGRRCVWLGVALGLGLLVKSTMLVAAPVIALAIVLGTGWRNVRDWLPLGAVVVLPAALIASPWYAFMRRTYGNLDAFAQIAALQGWWNKPAGTFLGMLFDPAFVGMRFREAWGEYGWRMMPLGLGTLGAIGIGSVICLAGLYLYAVLLARGIGDPTDPVERPEHWQKQALFVLLAACLAAYLAVLQFGTRFALTQSRYLFPVAAAAAMLAALGLRTACPPRFRAWGPAVAIAAMLALNVWLFAAYVLPFQRNQTDEMPWLTGQPLGEPVPDNLDFGAFDGAAQ